MCLHSQIFTYLQQNGHNLQKQILKLPLNTLELGFDHMDVFEQFVYLMANHQKFVIKFLSKAIPLRTKCLFNGVS